MLGSPCFKVDPVHRSNNAAKSSFDVHYGSFTTDAVEATRACLSAFAGGLNGSTQHSILKRKDGVFGNASRLFSRLYGIRENRALGSLAAGRVAESDWASVWEAIIVNLFSAGPTRGNSSPATAPPKAGIDTCRARGNIQSYSARSIGAIDIQVAGPLALVGEQGDHYDRYRAAPADEQAWKRARRAIRCKLATNSRL